MADNLIDLNHYAVKAMLKILLQDKTTKKNIIWATTSYADKGPEYQDTKQIQIGTLVGLNPIDLQPRVLKSLEDKQARTKIRAEVYTSSITCNKMSNYLDADWFGYELKMEILGLLTKNKFNLEIKNGRTILNQHALKSLVVKLLI